MTAEIAAGQAPPAISANENFGGHEYRAVAAGKSRIFCPRATE
jgi:hypothetical protein